MSRSIVYYDVMDHPHSTHLCVLVPVRLLFFLVVLSEMQFCFAFRLDSRHTSPSVLLSLMGEIFGQLIDAFPFHSCVLVSYAITLSLKSPATFDSDLHIRACIIYNVPCFCALATMRFPRQNFPLPFSKTTTVAFVIYPSSRYQIQPDIGHVWDIL